MKGLKTTLATMTYGAMKMLDGEKGFKVISYTSAQAVKLWLLALWYKS